MRRVWVILTLSLCALLVAAPAVSGAETFHFTSSGNSASATFSNLPEDKDLVPGESYFYTNVWASTSISSDGDIFDENGVCVFHFSITVDENGEWQVGEEFGACADNADFVVSNRLTGASLVAEVPVEECTAWDPETEECVEVVNLGTVMIDLDWTGEGAISRYHGTNSGGRAGTYQYTQHGTGSSRAATPSGSVDLVAADGSATDLTGGLAGNGDIQRSRDGYTEVVISGGQ